MEQITNNNIQALNEQIEQESAFIDLIKMEVSKAIIGQQNMVNSLLIGLLSNGHILLEGVPGLAKTLAINSLAKSIDASFSRIQFTPDLLPADVIGTEIYSQKNETFSVKKGPIFANFILADEINRAPAKVQSALLEAMQERQVTIGNETFKMQAPFLVLATQNPVEQEGTYPLPEAQMDRFMLKVDLGYPEKHEEQKIIRMNVSGTKAPEIQPVVGIDQIEKAKSLVRNVFMDEKIESYIVDLVFATRNAADYGLDHVNDLISVGASPRAGISMALAAKANAFINKRGFVIPEDIRSVCKGVLRHRIGLSYEAEAENVTTDDIIDLLINKVQVP